MLFIWVCTLGGAENKPYSIRNQPMFILIVEHCIDKFKHENLGKVVY